MRSASRIVLRRCAATMRVARSAEEVALDLLLRDGIERARGFVENQNLRTGHQRARQRDALPLSAGERRSGIREERVVAHRHRGDLVMDLRELRRLDDPLEGDVRILQRDVGADGRPEQKRVLRNVCDLRAQPLARKLGERAAVIPDASLVRHEQTGGERGERRLARSRRTDDRDQRSGRDVEGRIRERRSERAGCSGT